MIRLIDLCEVDYQKSEKMIKGKITKNYKCYELKFLINKKIREIQCL